MTIVLLELLTDQGRHLFASGNAANDLTKTFAAFGGAAQDAANALTQFASAERLARRRISAIELYHRRKGIRRKGGNFA